MQWPAIIELAGPVRGKGRGRAVGTPNGARVFTDAKTRTYEAQLRFAAQQVMAGAAPLEGPVELIVEARFEIRPSWSKKKQLAARRGEALPCSTPDADNLLKCCDALNGVVFVDDRQVVQATVRKVYSDRPGLTVSVQPVRVAVPLFIGAAA